MHTHSRRFLKFLTLYGQELTREEWEQKQELNHQEGRWAESEFVQPWHVGWNVSRDGARGWFEDDWSWSDSWTARKIIRPSYDQQLTVNLIVKIWGKRSKGKLRPYRFRVSPVFGETSFLGIEGEFRYCKSISDALRRADKLNLDQEIQELLKHKYTKRVGQSSVFRLEGDQYVPWKTILISGEDGLEWPSGEYFETRWEKPWKGEHKDQWIINGIRVVRSYGCISSHRDPKNQPLTKQLGTWIPQPKEQD